MPDRASWRHMRLGDVLEIKHGYAFQGRYFGEAGSHVVVTPGNFNEQGGFKSKDGKEKWYSGPVPAGYVLNHGDVIVAMTEQAEGLLGSSAIVPKSGLYLHNQRIGLVRVTAPEEIDVLFAAYLFNTAHVRQQIRASASGVKIRHTSPSRIADVAAPLPSLTRQREIASTLAAYDALVENSLRRVQLLEEMAREFYRESFGSRSSERGAGWAEVRLGDVAEVRRGRSYRSAELGEDDGVPFLNLKCIDREGGFRRSGIKRYTGTFNDKHVARRGDILLAVTDMTQERRIVARAALVPSLSQDHGVFSMDLVKLQPKRDIPNAYLYTMLRFSGFADEVKLHANGANVLHLSPERISDFRFRLPPESLRSRYTAVAAPIFDMIDTLENQIQNLRQTRDLLLPRLMSGQLELKAD